MRTLLPLMLTLAACSGSVQDFDAGQAGGGGGTVAQGGGGGGTPMDAGFDAGTLTDAGVEVDAGTGCAGRAWKFCEDFESASAGQLPTGWTQLAGWGQGTVTVATDSSRSGSKALKSSSANAGQPRAQRSLSSLGATAGTHWGRVFYRVGTPAPNAMNTSNYFHITFVGLRAADESRVVDTVQSPQGTIQYLYNLPDDSCCNGSAYSWRYDGNWHCAEWYVNNGTDAYRFFLDGTEVTSIAFTGRTNARLADFTSIALGGIYYVNSNGTLNAWLDDLAIDDARIGCQ